MVSLLVALVFAATSSMSVYIPATRGYFNLGDSMVFLVSLIFGPIVGSLAGGVGSAISDVFLGYMVYAPATLVIKALEGYLTGYTFHVLTERRSKTASFLMVSSAIVAIAIASLLALKMVSSEVEITFVTIGTITLLPQPIVFALLAIIAVSALFIVKFHERNVPATVSCMIGGAEMVVGYFIYELLILGIAALAEVPANIAQVFVGTLIAVTVYSLTWKRLERHIQGFR